MSSEHSTLDKLPVEILRHIVSVGNCEAALALSRANKTLRTACVDPLVYKAIINNRNGNGGQRWQHHLPLSMESPVSSWARYALADSKAPHDRDFCLDGEAKASISWAPQLMVQNHPLVNLASALNLTCALEPYETEATDTTHALALCLALRLMSKEPAGDLGPLWPSHNSTPLWARTRRNLTRYLKQPLDTHDDDSIYFSAYIPAMLMQKRCEALMTVGLFSVILRENIGQGRIRRLVGGTGQISAMAVPTSTSIPFHLMMDVPLPFSPNATVELASCHLAKMTTAEFLEDGEWVGFYSMSYRREIDVDPPMHGLRFVVTANDDFPTTLSLNAAGEDAVGAFELYGKIAPETGQINLRKVYSGGNPVWYWACFMTPMGIVGSWGRGTYGGWVWLWKVGWAASQ